MPAPPVNDHYTEAVELTGTSGSLGPYVIDAADNDGFGFGATKSVWFKFTATANATGVYVSTQGSPAGDALSGDGEPSPAPYGNLDTRLQVWRGAAPPGTSMGSNEDAASDPLGYWSELTFNVLAGQTYWIQVGVFDPSYVGSVVLNWSGLPIPPPPEVRYGSEDCPIYVEYVSHGPLFSQTGGSPNTVTTRLPAYHDGDLALMAIIVNGTSPVGTPAGWTPVSGSPFTYNGGVVPPQVWADQQITLCWKVMSGTTFAASDGPSFNVTTSTGGRVYLFRAIDTGSFDEVSFATFAGTPVVASGLDVTTGSILDPPDVTPSHFPPISYPSLDAGVVGNHQWLAFSFAHASWPLVFDGSYPDDVTPDNMQMIDPVLVFGEDPPGDHNGPIDTVDHNESEGAWHYAYNVGDNPSEDSPIFASSFAPDGTTWGRVFFSFESPPGHFYQVLPSLAGLTVAVLAPESHRPPNDAFVDAYDIGATCPVTIVECTFGATLESGEPTTIDGFASSGSVWFRWTASESGSVAIYSTPDSTFVPMLAVYTGSSVGALSLVDQDAAGGPFIIAVTAGQTYYLAIENYAGTGAYGEAHVAVDCRASAPYWGILATPG